MFLCYSGISSDALTRIHLKRIFLGFNLVILIILFILTSEVGVPWRSSPSPFVHVLQGSPKFIPKLSPDDYRKLINLNDFYFIRNRYPCNSTEAEKPDMLLVILIHSSPKNWKRRQVIRETWASWTRNLPKGIKIHVLFLIGEIPRMAVSSRVEEEVRRNVDIIQGKFVDSYRNLSYKHVMALKWSTYYCPNASYVIKSDDDVFIHIPKLVKFLTRTEGSCISKPRRSDLILCHRWDNVFVPRDSDSMYRVSPEEYPGNYYPPYCMGCAIIYSQDGAFKLYEAAQSTPFFWIDDVLVSGILAHIRNITLSYLNDYVLVEDESLDFVRRILKNQSDFRLRWYHFWRKDYGELIFACQIEPENMKRIWNFFSKVVPQWI